MKTRSITTARRRTPAFTIIEMLVAVGAVAIVGVGLAAIFSAVGKTVSGGRRLSLLNSYAGLVENTMREDFEKMSRDGFLVIRQQYVDRNADGLVQFRDTNAPSSPDEVPVDQEGHNARVRRIDELLFFANGDFVTARAPVHPDVIARAKSAMIYYGHGQRRRPVAYQPWQAPPANNDKYRWPSVTDDNAKLDAGDTNAQPPRLGVGTLATDSPATPNNPNEYASSWTLLRRVTLLAKPPVVPGDPYPTPTAPAGQVEAPARLTDKDCQFALQPAAASVFRSLNRRFPDQNLPAPEQSYLHPDLRLGAWPQHPLLASGIIDIATTDKSEVREIVERSTMLPKDITGPTIPTFARSYAWVDPSSPRAAVPTRLDLMQAWMDDAFPTESREPGAVFYPAQEAFGVRVRCEPSTPNLLEVVNEGGPGAPLSAYQSAMVRADQHMLDSSNFLPRCTEFIVEWSFGQTDATTGETVWYGLNRIADTNHDGHISANEALLTQPYPYHPGETNPMPVGLPVLTYSGGVSVHLITDRLIYGFTPDRNTPPSVLTSYFGYSDPTYPTPQFDASGNPTAGSPVSDSAPWLWPRLIRVTVTLADPQDPTVESSFQFIFKTPEEPVQ